MLEKKEKKQSIVIIVGEDKSISGQATWARLCSIFLDRYGLLSVTQPISKIKKCHRFWDQNYSLVIVCAEAQKQMDDLTVEVINKTSVPIFLEEISDERFFSLYCPNKAEFNVLHPPAEVLFKDHISGDDIPLKIHQRDIITETTESELYSYLSNKYKELTEKETVTNNHADHFCHDVVLKSLLALKMKFNKDSLIYDHPSLGAVSVLAWCNFVEKIDGKSAQVIDGQDIKTSEAGLAKANRYSRYQDVAREMILSLIKDYESRTPKEALAIAVYIDRAISKNKFKSNFNKRFEKKSEQIILSLQKNLKSLSALEQLQILYLLSLQGKGSEHIDTVSANALKSKFFVKPGDTLVHYALLLNMYDERSILSNEKLEDLKLKLQQKLKMMLFHTDKKRFPWGVRKEKLQFDEYFKALYALSLLGEDPQNHKLVESYRQTLFHAYDFEKAELRRFSISRKKVSVKPGVISSPWHALIGSELVNRFSLKADYKRYQKEYNQEQIKTWESPPCVIKAAPICDSVEPILILAENKNYFILAKKGNVLFSSFEILSYFTYNHTIHPLSESFFDYRHADDIADFERIFISALIQHASEHKGILTVCDWPKNKSACLTIRHDVDRLLSENCFETLLNYEKKHKLGVTWFWLPNLLKPRHMDVIANTNKHENALHSLRIQNKKQDKETVENASSNPFEIKGECSHGGGGGDNWIGAPSVFSAYDAGLSYTEPAWCMNRPSASFPHINENMELCTTPIVGMTRPTSVDNKALFSNADEVTSRVKYILSKGDHCLLLNHPDINFDQFSSVVDALNLEDVQLWSCENVADWWSSTHNSCALGVSLVQESECKRIIFIKADNPVKNLCLSYRTDDICKLSTSPRSENHIKPNLERMPCNNGYYIYANIDAPGFFTLELLLDQKSD